MKNVKKALKDLVYTNRRNYYQNLDDIDLNVSVGLGARRLFFGQTYHSNQELIDDMLKNNQSEFCVAFYIHEPQVLLDMAEDKLYLDPCVCYRLELNKYQPLKQRNKHIEFRFLREKDLEAINKIYKPYGMYPLDKTSTMENHYSKALSYFVAVRDGEVVGIVIGLDHMELFNSPEGGCSLFGLAVMPGSRGRGIGKWLINHVAEHYHVRSRSYVDLYVDYDNKRAIGLYEKMGFRKIKRFSLKRVEDKEKEMKYYC